MTKWQSSEKKQAIIDELYDKEILVDELKEQVGKDMDIFDLICHVAFDQPPLTRKERAENVKKRNYFTKYDDRAGAVLVALLDKYADEGIENIESLNILHVKPFDAFGSPVEIIKLFGGRDKYLQAIAELEQDLS